MNIVKKAYCRTFQQVMHAAIPFLPYRKPVILDNMKELAAMLKNKELKNVLLVTDKPIREHGLTLGLEEALEKAGINCFCFDETVPNPTTDIIEKCATMYLEKDCEAFIGLGGGSAMDCAKAAAVRIARPNTPFIKMKGILKVLKKLPLVIAIPTTAGTGSEVTVAAIVTDSETRHKYQISDFPLIPKYAVLDPSITVSLPQNLTATTGMDALTHAVEAYIGHSLVKSSKKDARHAVRLIFDNIRTAYEHPKNLRARRNMLHASFLAGSAFTVSYVGYVHCVAHSLGGKYDTPHGLANAVLLPFVLEDYGESAHEKLHQLACVIGISDINDSHAEGARKFIDAVKQMKKDLNVPDTIKGIKEEDIPELAKIAEKEGNPVYPVPKLMTAKELERYYYMVMEKDNTDN